MKEISLVAGAMVLGAAMTLAFAQDEGKGKVERPVRKAADVGKRAVERPILEGVAAAPSVAVPPSTMPVDKASEGKPDAGRVAPGLVAWHPSFEAAVEAAARSGKPVLLFQLLGKLDDEWC